MLTALKYMSTTLAMLLAMSLATVAPAQAFPQEVPPLDFIHQNNMTVQGPDNLWGMRRVATQLQQFDHTDDIRVFDKKGVKCSDHPNSLCVTVSFINKPNIGWGASTYVYEEEVSNDVWVVTSIDIQINEGYPRGGIPKQYFACHEFGHTWGLLHHGDTGCVGHADINAARSNSDWPIWLGGRELDRVTEAYGGTA
jgi:hypothetical protein